MPRFHNINGERVQFTEAEEAARDAEEQAWEAGADARAAAQVREERDAKLATSDWMALADRITDDWRTYRQALRDVPTQAEFPTDVTWPVEPS